MSDLTPLPTLPLGRYRHYKGGEYEVIGVVRHSETEEPLVLYRPLYNVQIIDDLEPTRRGLYGGAVGYLDFAGGSDTAIAIRTALIRNNVAYVQAGAGLVADSDPAREDQECRDKAAAVLKAVAVAATMQPAVPADRGNREGTT